MKFSCHTLTLSLALTFGANATPTSATTAPPATLHDAHSDTIVDYPETWFPELAQILDHAQTQAPQLIIKNIEQDESLARLKQAKAAYYPRLDFNGDFGYRKDYYSDTGIEDTDDFGVTFNATLRRPLYHWGAIEARIRQARLDHNSETLERTLTLRRIKRSIRADYLSLLVNQTSLRNARFRRQTFEDIAAQIRTDFTTGLRSAVDAEQNALNLNEAIMNIDALQTEQTRILANFKRNIGWQTPLNLPSPPPPSPPTPS